jgi:hypothetical protein
MRNGEKIMRLQQRWMTLINFYSCQNAQLGRFKERSALATHPVYGPNQHDFVDLDGEDEHKMEDRIKQMEGTKQNEFQGIAAMGGILEWRSGIAQEEHAWIFEVDPYPKKVVLPASLPQPPPPWMEFSC